MTTSLFESMASFGATPAMSDSNPCNLSESRPWKPWQGLGAHESWSKGYEAAKNQRIETTSYDACLVCIGQCLSEEEDVAPCDIRGIIFSPRIDEYVVAQDSDVARFVPVPWITTHSYHTKKTKCPFPPSLPIPSGTQPGVQSWGARKATEASS